MKLFLFTDNFPYGFSEPFLESEITFLTEKFEKIFVIPLFIKGEKRSVPKNVEIFKSIISFSTKDKKNMLINGIFNLSHFGFAVKEFFAEKVYKNVKHLWNFCTATLLFRAMFANKNLKKFLKKEVSKNDKFYFYWGNKSAFLVPVLKKYFPENKIFVRFHRTDLYKEVIPNFGYVPFRKHIFPAIDTFVPISENGKSYLLENYKSLVSENKISVQHLGVFSKGKNQEKKNREVFHLLSCSWVVKVKRIDLIINALRNINIPICWTHIGSGELMNEMQNAAKNLPKNVEVNFLGAMKNEEVMRYFTENHIDLFINVSESEGVPVSIMEALSFGVPVLATDVGGTSEIVDNQVGKLLNVNISPKEISDIITTFASQNLTQMRENSLLRWSERSNAEKNYRNFAEFLKSN